MEQRPTKKQKELLSFIDGFIKGNGYGPSYREIMRALDYKSVSTVATHVNGLITRGWLRKQDNEARTLEVVGHSDENQPVVAVTALTVEQVLRKKLADIAADPKADSTDIQALERSLVILGFEPKTHLA